MKTLLRLACGGSIAVAIATASPAFAQQLDSAVSEAERSTANARASQARINNIDDQTDEIVREYRAILQQIESQKLFVEQQKVFLKSQENELADLEIQISDVDEVRRNLAGLPSAMIGRLEQFVALDIPFRADIRANRIAGLRAIEVDHNVPPAERYRKILEAYQIEAEYGRNLDTWVGPLDANDPNSLNVDYLLVGRLAYFYMTQDESEMGLWDASANEGKGGWQKLPASYKPQVRKALRIAKQITSPDVILLPVPAAADAEGAAAVEGAEG